MNNINLFFIRHGESLGNLQGGDFIGQPNDSPLSQNGTLQAEKLGKRFLKEKINVDLIYSSTFKRAFDTATIFAKTIGYNKDIIQSSEIREYDCGTWRGLKRSEIYADFDNFSKLLHLNMHFKFPNGESYYDAERRASAWLDKTIVNNEDILKLAEEKPLNIIVVSHGQLLKTLCKYITGIDNSFLWKLRINNTAISHFTYNDRGWFLNSINDDAHLSSFAAL